jgi:hypothetical protein
MNLFQRNQENAGQERLPNVPRVEIQGEQAVIPNLASDPSEEEQRVQLPKKVWG